MAQATGIRGCRLHIGLFFYLGTALAALGQPGGINGRVWLDSVGIEPAIGAFLNLRSLDDASFTRLTATDTEGRFAFAGLPTGAFELKVTHLGYAARTDTLRLSPSQPRRRVELVLLPGTLSLPQVQVEGRAPDVTQRGDTLRYRADAFRHSTDRTLGHLLERMPGIELSESGQITYNGRRVDDVFVEGKDIINQQHRLAAEGVPVGVVQAVDIIEEEPSGEGADAQARTTLNVRLTEAGRRRLFGNVYAALGHPARYEAGQNVLRVRERSGFSIFSRLNNTGEPLLTSQEYLGLQANLLRWLNQFGRTGDLSELLPDAFQPRPYLQGNDDQLLALNVDAQPTDILRSRTHLLLSHRNTRQAADLERFYPATVQTSDLDYQAGNDHWLVNGAANTTWKWDNGWSLEAELPVNWQQQRSAVQENGRYLDQPVQLRTDQREHHWDVNPQAYLEGDIDSNWRFRASALAYHQRQGYRWALSDVFPFYEQQSAGGDGLFTLVQPMDREDRGILAETGLERETAFGEWEWYARAGRAETTADWSTSAEAPDAYAGGLAWRQAFGSLHWRTTARWKGWRLQAELAGRSFSVKTKEEAAQNLAFTPSFSLRHRWSRLHFLLLSGSRAAGLPGAMAYADTRRLTGTRTAELGAYPLHHFLDTRQINATYFFFDLWSRFRILSTVSYSQERDAVGNATELSAFEQLVTKLPISGRSVWTCRLDMAIPLSPKRWNLRLSGRWQHLETQLVEPEGEQPVRSVLGRYVFSLNSPTQAVHAFRWEFVWLDNRQSFTGPEARYQEWQTRLHWTGTLHPRLVARLLAGYRRGRSLGNTRDLPLLDAELRYQPDNVRFGLALVGRNLLNLNGREQLATRFTPVAVDNLQYAGFPGYLLLRAEWSF